MISDELRYEIEALICDVGNIANGWEESPSDKYRTVNIDIGKGIEACTFGGVSMIDADVVRMHAHNVSEALGENEAFHIRIVDGRLSFEFGFAANREEVLDRGKGC